ncbi:MAG: ASCH domain-containing protein [Defluviitaleaceae bacterium]|nr:ASCH domain-containing protein [Defluviitaleaceae bacterium]
MTADAFWQEFLAAKGLDASTKHYDCFHFCNEEKLANDLLALVLSGVKVATSSAFPAYAAEGAALPQVGNYSIVTDFAGKPFCVIQTTAVTVMPFGEVTYEICKREGEDKTLDTWREGHIKFFTQDAQEYGYEFSEAMPIVFEDFAMVYQLK